MFAFPAGLVIGYIVGLYVTPLQLKAWAIHAWAWIQAWRGK